MEGSGEFELLNILMLELSKHTKPSFVLAIVVEGLNYVNGGQFVLELCNHAKLGFICWEIGNEENVIIKMLVLSNYSEFPPNS